MRTGCLSGWEPNPLAVEQCVGLTEPDAQGTYALLRPASAYVPCAAADLSTGLASR